MFPTDAKLLNRARERLVRLAKKLGLSLRQSYRRVGKLALIKHQRYAHAHQFKRANRSLRKLKNLSRADRSQHRAGTKPVVGISMAILPGSVAAAPEGLGLCANPVFSAGHLRCEFLRNMARITMSTDSSASAQGVSPSARGPTVGRSLPTIERGNRTITRRERCRLRERKLS